MAITRTLKIEAEDDYVGLTLADLEQFVQAARAVDMPDDAGFDVEYAVLPANEERYSEEYRLTSVALRQER